MTPSNRIGPASARAASAHGSAPRTRAGFTVVEIIVAIMVLAVGVLGLAATAGIVQRQMAGGERQSAAAAIAQSRFDSLTSKNCNVISGSSGTASHRGGLVTEIWSVTDGANVKQITDTVQILGRRVKLVYTTYIACRNTL